MKALTPNMEMYLKTILEIADQDGQPRVKLIADRLGVKMPSVTGAVDNLRKKGLVDHTPYGVVKLTTKGRRVARDVKLKNDVIYQFLRDVLRLPKNIAATDACELEHVVSRTTLERFTLFLEFTKVCRKGGNEMLTHFAEWLESADRDKECAACKDESGARRCTS